MSIDLDVLRSKLGEVLLQYWRDSVALDIAQDQFDQTEAQLRDVLDRFLKAGGTQDDLKTVIERVEREL